MAERARFGSEGPWEDRVGYSRAVRVGDSVFVAGTTAVGDDGKLVGVGDAHLQAVAIFKKIEAVLVRAGSGMRDVVRTRMFVTDIGQWEEIGRAHAEFFGDVRPAATMVEVSRLLMPEMLVEIEVEARLDSGAAAGNG